VAGTTASDGWIVDGNYSTAREAFIERVEAVIWLDPGFGRNLWQLLCRTSRRLCRREVLWHGNREQLSRVVGPDSIVCWLFKSYWRRRRELPPLLDALAARRVMVLRFSRPVDAWRCLRELAQE
jgi:hypothetical protein